jgi:hypothetical protein
VLAEELAGVLPALAELLAVVGVPGTGLLDDPVLHTDVDDGALRGDALAVEDVELRLLEGRGDLVLHDLDAHAVADDVGAVLERLDPAHVQPHRRVELQRPPTRRGLRTVVHQNPVHEVVVVALHLDVEPVHAAGLRLGVDVEDGHGRRPQPGGGEHGLDGEPPAEPREQLVVHGRVDEGGDQLLEPAARLDVEDQHRLAAPALQLGVDAPRVVEVQGEATTRPGLQRLHADLRPRAPVPRPGLLARARTDRCPLSMYHSASDRGVKRLRYSSLKTFFPAR